MSTLVRFGLWLELGTGVRGLLRGLATLPRGKPGTFSDQDRVGRSASELGVSNSVE